MGCALYIRCALYIEKYGNANSADTEKYQMFGFCLHFFWLIACGFRKINENMTKTREICRIAITTYRCVSNEERRTQIWEQVVMLWHVIKYRVGTKNVVCPVEACYELERKGESAFLCRTRHCSLQGPQNEKTSVHVDKQKVWMTNWVLYFNIIV
jgi:hypothetical protein